MKIRKYVSPPLILTVAFVLSVFLLFFMASLSFKQINTLNKSQKAITHSLDVRVELERLFSELKDAESAHRGYILSGDERYLEPYNYSHVSINKSLLSIKKLTNDNRERKAEFDTLYVMINERFKSFREDLSQMRRTSTSSVEFRNKMWDGKRVMDKIRVQINKITASEDKILQQLEREYESQVMFTPLTSSFLVIFSIAVFLLTFLTLKNNLKRMRGLNRSLMVMNETFKYAEDIGEISHWQYDLSSKKMSFSDNKFRLLGSEVNAFEPTVETFKSFVHPSDGRRVNDCFIKLLNETPLRTQYRVTRKDKKSRIFRTISKLISDKDGREIIIGIDRDVTAEHRNTIKLEKKNKQLRSTNTELSSFNHIVSHDLQEPMRKIQMFVSRIDENDINKMSDNSRSYLLRIQSSANRAQKLIDDLLVYSRLNKSDQPAKPTNLNDVLENAKLDLAQVIEEKEALILSDELPIIKVIGYQIQQLFVNLLSNSIKYAKANVRPEINITYRIADAREEPRIKKPAGTMYHQFTFLDNGIGFDNDYQSRIFVLFHRLHENDKYSGTGIGLAICTKMVESHEGYIFSNGVPDVGATFVVYLPV